MKPEKAARKRRLPWRRILLLPAVLLLAVAAYFIESRSGWSDLYRAAGVSLDAPDADLLAQTSTTVTVLDVGQGDAVLIGQDGAYCLIDTGPSDAKGDLVRDLQLAGISKLDYLVLTHPHADHTGGAREVLRNFAVGQLLVPPWDAQASGETADWPRGLFDLAAEQGTDVITAEDGTVYPLGSGTACPLKDYIETLRNAIDPALPLGLGEVPYGPLQVMHLQADTSALQEDTGWRPATPFEEGIRETIEWVRKETK